MTPHAEGGVKRTGLASGFSGDKLLMGWSRSVQGGQGGLRNIFLMIWLAAS